jgi:hypothetical protein
MRLADDLFRLAHDDQTGRPLLHPVALSTGLAAALLGDLVWTRWIDVSNGQVRQLADPCSWPADRVDASVLHLLRTETHPLRTWLTFFAHRSVAHIAARLEESGHLRALRSRRGLRPTLTYVPVDRNEAARPRAVLATRLMHRLPLDRWYVCVAGFMAATGLDATILAGSPEGRAYLLDAAAAAPPAMRELYAHTEALVGSAVLAHRA